MSDFTTYFGAFLGVLFTLAVYSFLYRENPWSRLAEHMFIGSAIGYGIAYDLDWMRSQWEGRWSLTSTGVTAFAFALLLGLLWYFRFSRKYFWLYRIPLAIVTGTGLGLAFRTVVFAQLLTQVRATAGIQLVGVDAWTAFNNLLSAVMVICVLLYFTFTVRQTHPVWKPINVFARYTMMAGFGAAYGYTILTRMSLYIGRCQFLLGIPPYAPENKTFFPWIALLILVTLIGYDLYVKSRASAKT